MDGDLVIPNWAFKYRSYYDRNVHIMNRIKLHKKYLKINLQRAVLKRNRRMKTRRRRIVNEWNPDTIRYRRWQKWIKTPGNNKKRFY